MGTVPSSSHCKTTWGELVERARNDLILMIRLQRTYDTIAKAIQKQRTPPQEVRELHDENVRRQQELDDMEAKVVALREEVGEVRKREEESRLELAHFQNQKASVTNEREFTAVINEIDFASKALADAEKRREELEGEIAALTDEIASRREARPEEEASHRDVVAAWEATKAELTASIHLLAAEASKLEQQLQPSNRSRFLRLLKNRHGKALAAVVEGSCSLCHFELRPHLHQRVRRAEEIITCEHCSRILFLPEVEESETA